MSYLVEKWQPVLENDKLPPITDNYRARVTAQLLENQDKFLKETAGNLTANIDTFDPIIIKMVRRMAPKLIGYDVCGVQAMTGPTGLIFCLRAKYTDKDGFEALFNEADTDFSGSDDVAHAGDDPWDSPFTTGVGKDTADGEVDAWRAMALKIEKTNVLAKTRQLRADYSPELAQDLKAIHGLDAREELLNILSLEIINEINREIVRTIYDIAKPGTQWKNSNKGTFDLDADSDGRYFIEKFKSLLFSIEREANVIRQQTRIGKGNIIITSSDVASALAMAGVLNYAPALQNITDLDTSDTGVTYAGSIARYKVYVDPFLGSDGYVVGYKGASPYDAGCFYCPYVPLQLFQATDPATFQPAIGFKTRYGIVSNPFTSISSNSNVYYRKVKVTNLL